jgi:hypothetical protein
MRRPVTRAISATPNACSSLPAKKAVDGSGIWNNSRAEGLGIDDTMTSMRLDVTPRRISTEYGLSRAVKNRSIKRCPSAYRLATG